MTVVLFGLENKHFEQDRPGFSLLLNAKLRRVPRDRDK